MTKKKKKQTTEDRIAELENNWKRALADYQNLQKRVTWEVEEKIESSKVDLLFRILPILDNLQAMFKHNEDPGLKMIVKDFETVLEDLGAMEIDAKEKPFDARYMEAVELVSGSKDLVKEVIQKGYMFNKKVLRPARVVVGGKKEKK